MSQRYRNRSLLLYLAVVVLVAAPLLSALAGCGGGGGGGLAVPAKYKTIQEAIDAAKDGQVIVVSPGTYRENISFKGKAITVQSTKPDDAATVAATIIDGGDRGVVVAFVSKETAKSTLLGLTIKGGRQDFANDNGGGIRIIDSSPTISGCVITGNSALRAGAGITVGGKSEPLIRNNTITGNTGIPIWVGSGSHPIITANTVTSNQSPEFAVNGSITVSRGKATISNNTIAQNASYRGGGIFAEHAEVTITGNTIESNSAQWEGGGIRLEESTGLVEGNTIRDNTTGQAGTQMDSHGAGVALIKCNGIVLEGNTIKGNRDLALTGNGGGVAISGGSATLRNNMVEANTAVMGGGLIIRGGAAATVTGNTFKDNVADRPGTRGGFAGGAIYVTADSTLNGTGQGQHSPPAAAPGGNSFSGNKHGMDPLFGDPEVGYDVFFATR